MEEEAKEVLAEEQVPEVLKAFLQEIEALRRHLQRKKLRRRLKAVQKSNRS